MGGERERAELAAFEALLSKCIADALVGETGRRLRRTEWTWLRGSWATRARTNRDAFAPTQRPLVEDQRSQPNRNASLRSILEGRSRTVRDTRRVGSPRGRIPVNDRGAFGGGITIAITVIDLSMGMALRADWVRHARNCSETRTTE